MVTFLDNLSEQLKSVETMECFSVTCNDKRDTLAEENWQYVTD